MHRHTAVDMENQLATDGYVNLYNVHNRGIYSCCYGLGCMVLFGFGMYIGYIMNDCDGSY